MKKLLASIVVLIIATTISFTNTELDSNDSVESYELKKEIITAKTVAATSNNMKN